MLIEAEDLCVTLGGRRILTDEAVRCVPGTMTALVGPSGSGKTTLLHCLGLLLPVDSGRIVMNGRDVANSGERARRRFWREHAAFVLQDYGIMDEESVAFNVTMRSSLWGRVTGDRGRLARVLERTGLAGRDAETASHLSGGEKQRLALARALYKGATAVFVDEPTASLDADNRRRVIALLAELAGSGCTVVVATHDADMVDACDAIHEVGKGR